MKIENDDCKNCKWFEKANYINFCNNSKFGFVVLPKGIYHKCPDWTRKGGEKSE